MTWRYRTSILATFSLAVLSEVQLSRAGNTTCVSRQLDWYTSVVGESPCMTYQRLRQICNNDYQVPSFKSTVPGDLCDDQVFTCCSNSIAFQLSMLCMVCQQDTEDNSSVGIDAPKGSLDVYSSGRASETNHTLPDNIQRAVCNNNIRLDNFLYGGWNDGAWFYVYTKENAELDHASNNNNTFTHCPNQASASSTPKSAPSASKSASSTPTSTGEANGPVMTSTSSTKPVSRGALIGGIVGGVAGLTVLIVLAIIWARMRRKTDSSKGSQWSQNPRFGYMFSSTQASGGAPKSELAESSFGTGGPLSSFSYYDPDYSIAGSCTTSPRTASSAGRSNVRVPVKPSPQPRADEKAPLDPPLRSNPRSFSEVYGTELASEYFPRHTESDGARRPASVSLSTFAFAGLQVPEDAQTTRSFPLSVAADGTHTIFHEPPSSRHGSRRPPAAERNTRTSTGSSDHAHAAGDCSHRN